MIKKVYNTYGAAPFVRTRIATGDLMYLVVLALLPCAGVGIFRYGFHAALLIGISVGTAIVCEFICDLGKKKRSSITDYSCVVTGLIGGLLLPPNVPLWYAVLGSFLAIVLFKHVFGGLGKNLFNPAMAARFVLILLFYEEMNDFSTYQYTEATPLLLLRSGQTPALSDMLTGNTAGCIGTSSAAAVLVAALILLLFGLIDLWIPAFAILGFSFTYMLIGDYGLSLYTQCIQLCGGGFLFTAFIMAQDYTTSPVSSGARTVYGLLFGVLTCLFREAGFWEYACVPALLIVNALRPLLDKKLSPKPFGASAHKWVVKEKGRRRREDSEKEKERDRRREITNELLDAEFEKFEAQIEKQTRGLETARYTGDDTFLRQAYAEAGEEGTFWDEEYDTSQRKGKGRRQSGEMEGYAAKGVDVHPYANPYFSGGQGVYADPYAGVAWQQNSMENQNIAYGYGQGYGYDGYPVPGEFESVVTNTQAIDPHAIHAALGEQPPEFWQEGGYYDAGMYAYQQPNPYPDPYSYPNEQPYPNGRPQEMYSEPYRREDPLPKATPDQHLSAHEKRLKKEREKKRAARREAESVRDTTMEELEEILIAERNRQQTQNDAFSQLQFMDLEKKTSSKDESQINPKGGT